MKKSNWAPTEWSDASGMRRIISQGKQGDSLWPDASEQRKVKDGGIVEVEPPFTGTVSVVEGIPDTKQRWDKDYPGVGITGPAEDGPAVAGVRKRRGGQ